MLHVRCVFLRGRITSFATEATQMTPVCVCLEMDPVDARFEIIQVGLYGFVLCFGASNRSMTTAFANVDNKVLFRGLQFCERCVNCGKDGRFDDLLEAYVMRAQVRPEALIVVRISDCRAVTTIMLRPATRSG